MQLLLIISLAIYLALGVPSPLAKDTLGYGLMAQAQTDTSPPKVVDAGSKNPVAQVTEEDIGGLFIRGEDHLHHWEIDKADEAAKKILGLQPDSPEGLYLTAKVRFYQGRYKEALELLKGSPQNFLDGRRLLAFITNIHETTKDFREHPTEHFVIRYTTGKDEVLLEDTERALEQVYKEIGHDLRYFPEEKIVVEVYPSVDSFSAASTLKRKEIETSGTVAICHFNRLMIMSPRLLLRGYPWMETLAHEYVHYIITKRTRNLTPIWFHEGLAKYEESRWKSSQGMELTPVQSHLLAQAIEQDYFITFEEMHPSIAKLKSAEDAALAFAEVLTAMRYIVEKGGYPLLNKILDEIGAGRSVEEAVEVGLGMPFEDFERDWRAYMRTLGLKKIPGLRVMPLKIKGPGAKEESPTEIEVADARKFTMLGDLLEEENRPDAALFEYKKARKHAGLGSPQILNKLARAYMQNHRDDDAQRVLHDALSYYPNYVTVYITQGELHKKRGETDRAIESFKSASHINPFNPAVHQRLAQLYTTAGNKEAAKKSLEKLAIILKEFGGHEAGEKGAE
ncbi:MAG: tetratricopeptide repeat protein [Candidatus Brocadiales bacterium]